MENSNENIPKLINDLLTFNMRLGCIMRNKFNVNGKGQFEISMRQFQILLALRLNSIDSISGLEQLFNISKSSLSLTISKMEKSGLIHKEQLPDDKDKRMVHLKITSKGEEITKKFDEIICESFTDFYKTLNEKQKEYLKIGVNSLVKVFE